MAFFLSFATRYRSISDLTWITYAAIPLCIPAVKRNDRSRIVAYVFDSARTPNSFFVDCFSFEANCFWKHQCVFGQLCIQLVRSKQVCDQQSVPGGGGEDSHMKQTGMLVVSLRGVNFGFWSRLGCSGQSAIILCRQGLV